VDAGSKTYVFDGISGYIGVPVRWTDRRTTVRSAQFKLGVDSDTAAPGAALPKGSRSVAQSE
jgi:hypothetical protein